MITASEIKQQWAKVAPYLTINSEQEYDVAVARLDLLLDEVGEDESHALYSLLDILGIIIKAYDDEHYRLPSLSGTEALIYLMEEHSLAQADLPEIGSQGVVSEIINGKRQLNVRQIQALAERFKVSPSTFFP